jgi:polysaccharide pyruvyl transferase WcaK-like protein
MRIFHDALTTIPQFSIGSQAMILGSMQIIKRRFPDATFVMISGEPEWDARYLEGAGFEIEMVKREPSQIGYVRQLRQIVKRVDGVACTWGDCYTTSPPHLLAQKVPFLKKRGIPLVLFTASIGPLEGGYRDKLTKWGLKHFDQLTVRDMNTKRFLQQLGLPNVRAMSDTAFVLEPAPETRVREILKQERIPDGVPLIGLNASILLQNRFKDLGLGSYAALMAELIEFIRKTTQAQVVLIPHQVIPLAYTGPQSRKRLEWGGDDREAIRLVSEALPNREGVFALEGEYTPAEYKGVIGACELFIGGRMHSVIGALSTLTPSVIMQYSHKAGGVMKMLGLDEYVWDIQQPLPELTAKIEKAWKARALLRNQLEEQVGGIIEDAYGVGQVFAEAFASGRRK